MLHDLVFLISLIHSQTPFPFIPFKDKSGERKARYKEGKRTALHIRSSTHNLIQHNPKNPTMRCLRISINPTLQIDQRHDFNEWAFLRIAIFLALFSRLNIFQHYDAGFDCVGSIQRLTHKRRFGARDGSAIWYLDGDDRFVGGNGIEVIDGVGRRGVGCGLILGWPL